MRPTTTMEHLVVPSKSDTGNESNATQIKHIYES